MKLIKKYNNLDEIANIGIKHCPNEFGGFLIGNYSQDFKSLHVENFILPIKYKGFPYLFERSIDGMINQFINLFRQKKQYYIGEWHTHPNSSTQFSQTDLNAMIQTVECETVKIINPILLILSVDSHTLNDFTFYYYNNKNLLPYE